MESFRSIKQLQKFEPARSYLWDLSFAYIPFNKAGKQGKIPNKVVAWIPADSLSRVVSVVNSGDLTAGQTGYRFPSGGNAKEISINFMDDYKGSVKDWLECWMEEIILGNGEWVNYLSECVDILTIDELLPSKEVYKTSKLYVYPDGVLQEQFTSETGVKVYSITFVVCGKA